MSRPDPARLHCIALHGFTGGGRDFGPLEEHLTGLDFEAPDLPGHGGEDTSTKPFTIDNWARQIAVRFRNKSVLLGYSLGARVALQTAILKPPFALILISGTPGIIDDEARLQRRAADADLADRIERVGVQTFLDEWARTPIIATQSRAGSAVHRVLESVRRHHQASGLAAALRGCGTGSMAPLWSKLPECPCPTLLVTGSDDHKFQDIAERMVTHLPDARIATISGCGHAPHFEAPERVAAAIQGFLSSLVLPA